MQLSLRTTVTVVAGAALLALAANTVTYAATGDMLILGHSNSASKTTGLSKSGPGPALELHSQGNAKPSLSVSSDAQVKNLNASLLGGKTAASLSSKAVTYLAGHKGDPIGNPYKMKIPPGVYQFSFEAVFDSEGATGDGFVQCVVGSAGFDKVYVGSTNPYTTLFPLTSSATVAKITKGATFMECIATTDGVILYQPMSLSVVKLNGQSVHRPPVYSPPPRGPGLAAR